MDSYIYILLGLLPPICFLIISLIAAGGNEKNIKSLKRASLTAPVISILTSLILIALLIKDGVVETELMGIKNAGLSFRFDTLSIVMLTMISILSFIVIRFSHNYLDGDSRQGLFIGRLTATIASVQLLVVSGNIVVFFVAWVLTSVFLQKLLLFYKERPGAIIAARKKFIAARLADLCLATAFAIFYYEFQTGNLELIFQGIIENFRLGNTSLAIELAAVLIAAAAILKSAQFPLHGWLVEVMETPTPVSALLHAGLLNAGPFLVIRMAFIFEASHFASIVLIVVGSFTALFASIVFMTQTSIKTTLGYSSVGHMGFSLFLCGLGLYPAALLHVVAHSFYKAHAFLSSGSVIETIRFAKVVETKRLASPIRMFLGITLGLVLYSGFAYIWGVDMESDFYLIIVGSIVAMGLSTILTSAIDSKWNTSSVLSASLLSITVVGSFFMFEHAFGQILGSQLPVLNEAGSKEIVLVVTIAIIFALVVLTQIISPVFPKGMLYQKWSIHFRNGLYVNALFDRLVGALSVKQGNHKLEFHEDFRTKRTEVSSQVSELEVNQ